jgi:hypothetical protein
LPVAPAGSIRKLMSPRRALSLIALALCLSGCPEPEPGGGGWEEGPAPDFSLEDVNATSERFGEMVSPRDYLEQVSGWYFGHST